MSKAVVINRFGGPEVLEVVDVERPSPPPGGVVVEVRAAGVNPVEGKIRSGRRAGGPLTAPLRLGSDAAGVVVAVAPDATGFAVGDEVVARGLTGAYATHVVARPEQLWRKPSGVTFEQGAAIGIPAGTAYQSLRSLKLSAGESLLVHAGSGGVGQAAIQFARLWGATVVATASPANHDRLRHLGAVPVAYGDGLLQRIRAAAPDGVDVVLDAAGTDEAIDASLELVDDRSRIATVVVVERAAELGIRGFSGSRAAYLDDAQRALRVEALGVTADLAGQGKFELEIAASYPLASVVEAHRHSDSGHVRGKIVLIP
ncbi:NADP-dependent oxidoreductase [Virgisporangium aurantiacum]|uniref:Putative oxidoreductase n=1 Tax=Virgisporangium aurantiacum TaxID=175570 RepID=A0A8J3ZBC5_9ACTN|nr:NADP-dependent oxidoreductase [Virgisporangium aurantiacum]GIJ58566.1 putative oxidoreductase [Virgisporangium aurantiacum]